MIHPQALIKMFSYNAELIIKQSAEMTHTESLLIPPFEANTFNWVLGHIVSARSIPLRNVREEPIWTDNQRARYRNGSANVVADGDGVFLLEELVTVFKLSQERLLTGLERMTYEDMCKLSGYQHNTIGDSLAYFHFHEAHHIGQILYLAQMAGKKGVWLG